MDADLDTTAARYRRQRADQKWEETKPPGPVADKEKGRVVMAFARPGRSMTVTLTRDGDGVKVVHVARNTAAAQQVGLIPPEGKARLVVANQLPGDITLTIIGRPYTVRQGADAGGPASAFKVDLFPGDNQLVIRRPGVADLAREIPVSPGDAWGLILLQTGEVISKPLY